MGRIINGIGLGLVTTLFFGCGITDNRFVRKKFKTKDIEISWFYYSFISSNSPDFVEVSDYREKRIVYEAKDVITDVLMRRDTIILKLYKPERGIIYTDSLVNRIFGYSLVLDSNADYDEYRHRPSGILEK